jgi:ankyrin repeat protein
VHGSSKRVVAALLAVLVAHAAAADVNVTSADGSTALLWAAHRGDVA